MDREETDPDWCRAAALHRDVFTRCGCREAGFQEMGRSHWKRKQRRRGTGRSSISILSFLTQSPNKEHRKLSAIRSLAQAPLLREVKDERSKTLGKHVGHMSHLRSGAFVES